MQGLTLKRKFSGNDCFVILLYLLPFTDPVAVISSSLDKQVGLDSTVAVEALRSKWSFKKAI